MNDKKERSKSEFNGFLLNLKLKSSRNIEWTIIYRPKMNSFGRLVNLYFLKILFSYVLKIVFIGKWGKDFDVS